MFAPATRRRSGITLTEILISIMIMGVGMVSLATLFPLGLLRMREANRMTRSVLLEKSARNDILSRNLLSKQSFQNPLYNPFTTILAVNAGGQAYDPWLNDTPGPGQPAFAANGNPLGAFARWGEGLPVAYDPLWRATVPNGRYTTNPNFGGLGYYLNMDTSEARFGSGIGFVAQDNSGTGTSTPSAYGLQRLTNFNPFCTLPAAPANGYPVLYPPNTIANIFVSPEDIVFQNKVDATGTQSQNVSTVVPDMSFNPLAPTNDWRYTWMFTGHQASSDGTIFKGEIVVFENRPFSIDPVLSPGGNTILQPASETVVQAIFGFSPSLNPNGFARGADKTILLRWPSSMPDPDVRVGSWLADVTYERNATVAANRFGAVVQNQSEFYPPQRCNWYQIVKRSTPADESTGAGLQQNNFRAMTVWISSPLKAKTQNIGGNWVVNAALVCPYVVNVFERTIYTR